MFDRSMNLQVEPALDPSRRPSREVVCAICLSSVWFVSQSPAQSYCRTVFLVTWSTKQRSSKAHAHDCRRFRQRDRERRDQEARTEPMN